MNYLNLLTPPKLTTKETEDVWDLIGLTYLEIVEANRTNQLPKLKTIVLDRIKAGIYQDLWYGMLERIENVIEVPSPQPTPYWDKFMQTVSLEVQN